VRSVAWRKSTFSGYSECVEAASDEDAVLLRNSKHPDGPVISCAPAAWTVFLDTLKSDTVGTSI
jgi:hypothetical protein